MAEKAHYLTLRAHKKNIRAHKKVFNFARAQKIYARIKKFLTLRAHKKNIRTHKIIFTCRTKISAAGLDFIKTWCYGLHESS